MKKLTLLAVLLIIGLLFSSCKKENIKSAGTDKETAGKISHALSSFSPASGINYSAVTLTGTFSTTEGANVVKFNGVTAVINSVTATKIVATVPGTATTGKISVTTNGVTTTSANSFKVLKLVKENSYTNYATRVIFDKAGKGVKFATDRYNVFRYSASGATVVIYTIPIAADPAIHNYELTGIAYDALGNIYTSQNLLRFKFEDGNRIFDRVDESVIIKITPAGQSSKVLGGAPGNVNGNALQARFDGILDITTDESGQTLYISDSNGIKKADRFGNVTSTTLPPTSDFDTDKSGNLYAFISNQLFKVNLKTGVQTFIAGTQHTFGHQNGPGATAVFNTQTIMAVDGAGNTFILDQDLNLKYTLRVINTAGYVSTYITLNNSADVFMDKYSNKAYFLTYDEANMRVIATVYSFK